MISLKPEESESVATFAEAPERAENLFQKILKIFALPPKVPQNPAVTHLR